MQRDALGMRDLTPVVIEHPLSTLTHEEIAQLIGTSRETVTRVLSEFREKKFAQLRGSTLMIMNRLELEKLVGT